jgi:mRNA interferase MazF
VQGDAFNRSQIATVLVVPLTSNLRLAGAPGNVVLRTRTIGLPKDSVANVSQLITIDRQLLTERVGHVPRGLLELVLGGVDLVLGRERGGDDERSRSE